ncbi:hypothetical protein SLE2022_300190 [Rubroshorea leprosula]
MAGYDGDEYEDYDGYDMEGEQQYEEGYEEQEEEEEEEEEAEEEDHKPTEEEMEYLELRQRLKESIRQKRKTESGSLLNAREKEKKLPYDNYGSFFGPSQPVIAQRVIQESKSFLENEQLVSKMLESKNSKKFNPTSNSSGSKLGVNDRPPKISELKKKVEKLKMARDYSFLSDDVKLPVPAKEPPPRSISVPNSEARPAHMPLKSKQPLGNGSRNVQGVREERKSVSLNGHSHPKSGSYKPTSAFKPNLTSIDSKKQLSVNNGIGPGRPTGAKALPSKMSVAAMEKKIPAPGAKNPPPNMQKALSSKMQLSNSKQAWEQKKGSQELANSGILSKKPVPPSISKQAVPSLMSKRPAPSSTLKRPAPSSMSIQSSMSSSKLRSQMSKPLKQVSSHASSQFQKLKKKPLSEDEKALSMIRRMFNTPRFVGRDDDDYDDDDGDIMEASFDEIMREEKRSAKIARKEDEEQQRLIEEEERREQMRRLAKKQKLSH